MASYTVIGSGIAGLSLALELTKLGIPVRVIEYRDYAGGINSIYPDVGKFIESALRSINVEYSHTAVVVDDEYYEVWRDGYRKLGDNAIAATGFRVMTLPELGIYGDRPAGIYPFHAVLDLIHYGLLPGRNIVVYGDNPYAALMSKALLERGCSVTLVTPGKMDLGGMARGIEVLHGRVRYVRGSGRVERVLINDTWVKADTLVISMFKPYNPFPRLKAVGQAIIETYSPDTVIESGRILARELVSHGEYVVIDSDVPVFPSNKVSRDSRRVIITLRGGGKVIINDREYVVMGDAAVIELPDTDKVVIRRVVQ
jgi:NADPH-dependent 2,4-dienoyl-CoA reductase/sulfur reductase-like enzyme